MKKFYLLTKTLLVAVMLTVGANAWADEVVVPAPVYFNNFSSSTGLTVVGNGQFENDGDKHFGKIFHNDPTLTKAIRTNYLELPSDVLSHSATSKAMTITFWVNKKNAADYWYSPIFTAYGNDNAETDHSHPDHWWPFLYVQSRGILAWNSDGWCDFTAAQNDAGTNAENTYWLDDGDWHLFTLTLTSSSAKIYIDGNVFNSWTIANNGLEGFFTQTSLTHFYLGGSQAYGWNDPDPAYGFDDFAVYDVALSAEQIAKIISTKNEPTEIIGATDCSTYYLTDMTEKITLKPGESYHYSFINHNNPTYGNAWNWVLPVYNSGNDSPEIVLRSDNWEDNEKKDSEYGSNAGCWLRTNGSDDVWADYMNEMNGATVDMTVTYTSSKVINVDCDITTSSDYSWKYTYTSNYDGSTRSFTGDVQLALSISNSWLQVEEEGYSAVAATIGANGYTTFASPYPLDLTSATQTANGFTAYKASSINETTVQFTDGINQNVAANTGVLLSGTANATVTIPVVASGTALAGNALHVNEGGSTFAAESGYTYYGMIKDSTPLTFGTFAPGSVAIPADKAYLKVSDSGVLGAREIRAVFGGITGINEAAATAEAAQKDGKFIENGKLVIVKNGKKFNANGTEIK